MKKSILNSTAFCLAFSLIPFSFQSRAVATPSANKYDNLTVDLNVKKFKLDNGLTVLLLEDHSVPLVSYHTWYRVGSRYESPGVTGAAHMLEHMMFKGAKKYDGKKFDRILHENGMENNAFTSYDYTGFYQILPSDRLELMMDMEVDRMSSLAISPEDLKSEKEVVKEERRWRIDNTPMGLMRESLMMNLFKGSSYEWPVIGHMADIAEYTSPKLRYFYDEFYKPNNAVLVIVGDIDVIKTEKLVRKYYGSLNSGKNVQVSFKERTPVQKSSSVVLKKDVQNPMVMLAWPTVAAGNPDAYALDLAAQILAGSSSSRLYKKMIYHQQSSTSVFAYNYPMQKDGMFAMGASLKPNESVALAKKTLLDHLRQIKAKKVTDLELKNAKTATLKSAIDELTTLDGKAKALAVNEIMMGDHLYIQKDLELYKKVTADDILRVMNKYLSEEKVLTVELLPNK